MESQDPLLDAAADLAARGVALSITAVAAAAGVSRAAAYRRFPDRAALVDALVRTGRIPADPGVPDLGERVLDAVGVLIRRQGLAATTIEAVAEEAGVGPATVYRRFGDRAGLLRAFAAERSPRRLAIDLPPGGTGDLRADLLSLTAPSIAFFREYQGLFMLLYSDDPDAKAMFAAAREGSPSVRGAFAAVLDRHLPDPTGRTTHAFFGMMMMVAWAARGTPEEDAAYVVDLFLNGARGAGS
jgi:AcrR family transcriptional regulator